MNVVKRFSLFLLPSVFQAVISFAVLPITTYLLGPEEYGLFALMSSITAIVSVIATMGIGYAVAADYQIIDELGKKRMIASIFAVSFLISIATSAIILFLWPLFANQWSLFKFIPFSAVILSFVSMVLSNPWVLAIEIITLEGKAHLFAVVIIIQSLISAVAVTVSLFVFNMGVLSLFVASLSGAAVVFCGSIVALRPYLKGIISFGWIKKILKLGIATVPANIMESIYTFIERSILSLSGGLAQLGLYTHSQQYRTMAMMALKAATRTVWPITLMEAREEQIFFPKTKQTWDVVYVGVTFLGLLFATFGRDIIALLTHGKFADAYIFVALWMIYLLVQNAGKPHTGIIWAYNKGIVCSWMQVAAILISIISLILLVPVLGAYGALIALFIQMIIFRVCIQIYVRKFRQGVPFQDWWIIFGSFLILLTMFLSFYFQMTHLGNFILLLIMCCIAAFSARKILCNILRRIIPFYGNY